MKITGIALLCIMSSCNLITDKKNETVINEKEHHSFPLVNTNDSIKIVLQSDKTYYQIGDSIKFAIEVIGVNPDSGHLRVNGRLITPDTNGIYHWRISGDHLAPGEQMFSVSWRDRRGKVLSKMYPRCFVLLPFPSGYIDSEFGGILYRGMKNEITINLVDYSRHWRMKAKGALISKSGSRNYLVMPDDTSEFIQLSMIIMSPRDTIVRSFRVLDLPKPTLALSENDDNVKIESTINIPNQIQRNCKIMEMNGIEIVNGQIENVRFSGYPIEIDKSREIYFLDMRCKCPGIDSTQLIKIGIKYDQ